MAPTLDLEGVTIWRWHAASSYAQADRRRRGLAGRARRDLGAARPERSGQDDAPDGRGGGRVPERGTGDDPRRDARTAPTSRRCASASASSMPALPRGSPSELTVDAGRRDRRDRHDRLVSRPGGRRRPRARATSCSRTFSLERPRRPAAPELLARRANPHASSPARSSPRPPLLLLDEPGSGLDLPGRETLVDGARRRLPREEHDLAIVLTTHHLEELPASTTHGAPPPRRRRRRAWAPSTRSSTDGPLSACFGLDTRVTREPRRALERDRAVFLYNFLSPHPFSPRRPPLASTAHTPRLSIHSTSSPSTRFSTRRSGRSATPFASSSASRSSRRSATGSSRGSFRAR